MNTFVRSFKSATPISLVTKNLLPIAVVFAVLLIGAVVISSLGLLKGKNPLSQSTANTQTKNSENSVGINKEFNFPIYNKGEKTENNLKIVLTTAERSDKILVNGRPASAKDGKDFLILNLEITNPTNDKLSIRPVDFFRFVANDGKQYAADVHNDPVKAEPISIKRTRIGYVIDEQQKTFKFLVGEVNGEKQELEINI